MLFFGIKNIWFKTLVALVFAAWSALFVYLFYRDYYIIDPFNPNLTGTAAYGHNGEGAFQTYAVLLAIESAVLLATLIPFSFRRLYWIRPLILQMIFGFWMMLNLLAAMHAGGVHMLHVLYLVGINAIIFILFGAALAAEIRERRKTDALR